MFNESNVDNRSRHIVRGRVIVFTTSSSVEFLSSDLSQSIPLYSWYTAGLQQQQGLSFSVELDGFLTFDPGSEVKIVHSSTPFQNIYYDPRAILPVYSADPPKCVGYSYDGQTPEGLSVFVFFFANNTQLRVSVPSQTEIVDYLGLTTPEILARFPGAVPLS